jgi:hypothetical protein
MKDDLSVGSGRWSYGYGDGDADDVFDRNEGEEEVDVVVSEKKQLFCGDSSLKKFWNRSYHQYETFSK